MSAICHNCKKAMSFREYMEKGINVPIPNTNMSVDYCSVECLIQDDGIINGINYKEEILKKYKSLEKYRIPLEEIRELLSLIPDI